MRNPLLPIAGPIALAMLLAGCKPISSPPAAPLAGASQPGQAVTVTTDRWLGTWNGPEGTSLRIVGDQGNYQVTVQNLDGPRTFQGSAGAAESPEIRFERDGRKETIRASTGKQTGMKWLSDKKDCLTVRYGEGYCRN